MSASTLLRGVKTSLNQPPVIFENYGKLINAILNKPNMLNAIDVEITRTLSAEIAKWNQSPQIKAVTFQGAGGKAFSVGGDVKSVYHSRNEPLDDSLLDYFFREVYTLFYQVSQMKPIQIVMWDGLIVGGSNGICLNAPIKIATQNARYFMPEAKLGLHLNIGGGYYFSRLQDNLGYFIGLTGYPLKGEELVQCGIADYYVKSENLKKLEEKIQEKVNQEQEVSVQDLHKVVKEFAEPIDGGYKNAQFIEKIFGKPTVEKICQELEDKSTTNEFAKTLFERVKENSPITMKIIHKQIKQGNELDFKESLKVDMRLTKSILAGPEFFEGIRCVLVDKGDKPKWQHSSILDISDQEVRNYFKPLPNHLELNI